MRQAYQSRRSRGNRAHDASLTATFQVRRRLALQVDTNCGPMPPINTRPHRSNLAVRLQTAMNLQVGKTEDCDEFLKIISVLWLSCSGTSAMGKGDNSMINIAKTQCDDEGNSSIAQAILELCACQQMEDSFISEMKSPLPCFSIYFKRF